MQAVGFSLVPLMPSVWSLTALYFVICFSYNFTNSAVFTSLGWMFPKRAASALNLVLAMFGVGSFFIPLAAQACKYFLGSALAVFWVVGATSVVAALPFLFVASPTPPPPVLAGDGPAMFKTTGQMLVRASPLIGKRAGGGTRWCALRSRVPTRPQARVRGARCAQLLERVTTYTVVVLVFFTTAAETSIGNWLYTYGVRQVRPRRAGPWEAASQTHAVWSWWWC